LWSILTLNQSYRFTFADATLSSEELVAILWFVVLLTLPRRCWRGVA
jgi:hypothetical protein